MTILCGSVFGGGGGGGGMACILPILVLELRNVLAALVTSKDVIILIGPFYF